MARMHALTRAWVIKSAALALLMAVAASLLLTLLSAIMSDAPLDQVLLPSGPGVRHVIIQLSCIFLVGLVVMLWLGMADRRRRRALSINALEGLLLATPSGVILTDTDRNIREVNPAAARMFGVGPSVFGRALDELFELQDPASADASVPLESAPLQLTALSADGERFPVSITSIPLGSRAEDLHATFVTPLSDELTAAKSQRHAERQFQALFNGIPDGVFRSLPDGTLASANPALINMLGGDPSAGLSGKHDAKGFYVDPQDRRDLTAELVRTGIVRNAVLRLKRCDGETIRVLANIHAVRDPDHRPILFEGTLTDLTGFEIKPTT